MSQGSPRLGRDSRTSQALPRSTDPFGAIPRQRLAAIAHMTESGADSFDVLDSCSRNQLHGRRWHGVLLHSVQEACSDGTIPRVKSTVMLSYLQGLRLNGSRCS